MYYIYVYLNPFKPGNYQYDDLSFNYEPFYIGVSKLKNRYKHHLRNTINKHPRNKINNTIINKIIESGKEPIIEKIYENLTEVDALKLEVDLIRKIGRINKKTGPLSNIVSGGQIVNSELIKIRLNKNKKINSDKKRTVLMYDLEGNLLKQFESVKEARKETGITHIGQCCMGNRKTAGNHIWKYDKIYKKRTFIKHVKNIVNKYKVHQYDLSWNLIKTYESTKEFENTIFNRRMIKIACKKGIKYKDYYFKYGK